MTLKTNMVRFAFAKLVQWAIYCSNLTHIWPNDSYFSIRWPYYNKWSKIANWTTFLVFFHHPHVPIIHQHSPTCMKQMFFGSWHVYTLWNNTKFIFHIKPHIPINLHAYKISSTYEQVIFPYLPQILHFTMWNFHFPL